jgi:hypothetical protein
MYRVEERVIWGRNFGLVVNERNIDTLRMEEDYDRSKVVGMIYNYYYTYD